MAVCDGAPWIQGVIEQTLPEELRTVIRDFYHAAEHVQQARRAVFGEQTPEGKSWAHDLLQALLETPVESWWPRLEAERQRRRSAAKRQALTGLMNYLATRREHLGYATFRTRGLKIGSGPTEAACKSHARRLKGPGMRWTGPNAHALLALESLHQSRLWSQYWDTYRNAA